MPVMKHCADGAQWKRWITVGMLVAGCLPFGVVRAQNAFVFYDHRPGTNDAGDRTRYLVASDMDGGARRRGRPPILEIPEGQDACFVVESANTLLYSYSVAHHDVVVDSPSGMAELVAAFGGILGSLGGVGGSVGAPAAAPHLGLRADLESEEKIDQDSLFKLFASQVKVVVDQVASFETLRAESDEVPAMTSILAKAEQGFQKARVANDSAKQLFDVLNKVPALRGVAVLVQGVQQTAWSKASALIKDFRAAASATPQYCTTITSSRTRVALIAAPKSAPAAGQKWQRPTDTVATFLVDPISTQRFEIVPAIGMSFGSAGAQRFALDNGIVTAQPERQPSVTPGIFGLGRVTGPLWAAAGVSKGKELVDGFFGLVVRGGASKIGTNLILGAGLSLAKVPTDLKAGKVGEKLPADAKNLDDIIRREYRPGAAVIFTISGLALGGDTKTKEATADVASKK